MSARWLAVALLALSAAGAAFGGDAEFDRIVKAIETHYGTRPTHIPFMGVANFFVKVAHPEGASGIKLAVFEGIASQSGDGSRNDVWRDRDRFMDSLSGSHLHPLVRVHSRQNGEATYIFMDPEGKAGKSTRVLVATFGRDDATVVEVKANVERLLKSLQDPGDAKHTLVGGDTE